MVNPVTLDAGDAVVGAAGTTYPAPGTDTIRGSELGSDIVVVAGDGRSIGYTMTGETGTDQLRVILAE